MARCNIDLHAEGKPYPRTCAVHGLGNCAAVRNSALSEDAVMPAAAYRVKDYADGWILKHSLDGAKAEADAMNGALVDPLYSHLEPYHGRMSDLLGRMTEVEHALRQVGVGKLAPLDPVEARRLADVLSIPTDVRQYLDGTLTPEALLMEWRDKGPALALAAGYAVAVSLKHQRREFDEGQSNGPVQAG